jgi:hypothetical protein
MLRLDLTCSLDVKSLEKGEHHEGNVSIKFGLCKKKIVNTVKTENGYQAALRPRLPPRAAPRLVHQDLWPIRTNVGGFFFGFEVGIPDL